RKSRIVGNSSRTGLWKGSPSFARNRWHAPNGASNFRQTHEIQFCQIEQILTVHPGPFRLTPPSRGHTVLPQFKRLLACRMLFLADYFSSTVPAVFPLLGLLRTGLLPLRPHNTRIIRRNLLLCQHSNSLLRIWPRKSTRSPHASFPPTRRLV